MKLFKWYISKGKGISHIIFYSAKYDPRFKSIMYKGLSEVDLRTSEKDWYDSGPFSAPETMFVEGKEPPQRKSRLRLIIAIFKPGRKWK